jgi:formylglycine-generating enzyme required for sulfatase activity
VGKSLPSEAQWLLANDIADPQRDNYDFHRFEPLPVDHASSLTGNGWEWTRDIFAPFPGFAAHQAYPGYSADFFDNAHYVMKGASPRTSALLARPSFRNWFRPDYPHMYAGFRLVEE